MVQQCLCNIIFFFILFQSPPQKKVVHKVAQIGFTKETSFYEKTRPSYPPQALDHIIEKAKLRPGDEGTVYEFLDVAAGTGKFSRYY